MAIIWWAPADGDDDGHDDEDDDDDDDDDHPILSEQKLKSIHWKTELLEPFTYMVMYVDIWTRRQTLLVFICLCLCVYDMLRSGQLILSVLKFSFSFF